MPTMEQVIDERTVLSEADVAWLFRLVDEWSLLSDLSFADLILWVPGQDDNVFWACAQIRPTTGPTSLEDDVVGEEIAYDAEHLVTEAYLSGEICHTSGNSMQAGIPVDIQAIPIMFPGCAICMSTARGIPALFFLYSVQVSAPGVSAGCPTTASTCVTTMRAGMAPAGSSTKSPLPAPASTPARTTMRV